MNCLRLILIIQFAKLYLSQEDSFIYSPFYKFKYDLNDRLENSLQIKVANGANLLFIAAGFGGVIILDGQTGEKIFQESFDSQTFVNSIECSDDGNYFFISINPNLVRGYQFSSRNQKKISQLFEAKYKESITDMVKDSKEHIIYMVGDLGALIAVNFQEKNKLEIFAESESSGASKNSVSLPKLESYIYSSSEYDGSQIYKYEKIEKQIILVAFGKNVYSTEACIGTQDDKYLYAVDPWTGLFVTDLAQISQTDPSQYPVNLNMAPVWPFIEKEPNCFTIALSQSENLLFVGVRSQGVIVFSIKDKLNPIFFYQIQIITLSYYISFSKDYQYMYYANYYSVYSFELIQLNLNEDIPNIFNSHQVVEKYESSDFKWRCTLIDNDAYFFGSFDIKGLFISKFNSNPYQLDLTKAKHHNIFSQSLTVYENSSIFYTPILSSDKTLFQIYDYSTLQDSKIQDITFKGSFTLPDTLDDKMKINEYVILSKDQTLGIVTQGDGFILLQFNGPLDIKYLNTYFKPGYQANGYTSGAIFSQDKKYVLIAQRFYGLSLIEITKDYQFIEKDSLKTLGGETLRVSDISDDYCFFLDGHNGLAIVDLTVFPKIKILSQIKLIGWTGQVVPMYKDTYAFVIQRENGMISLIDIKDKENIFLYSSYQRYQSSGTSTCVTKDLQYAFVQNKRYVLIFPLKSQARIHTQAQEIQIINNKNVFIQKISKNQILEVGQIVQFSFLILYPVSEKMKIKQIKYYNQFQEKDLPSWMYYDVVSQTLTIAVDKQGVGENINKANQIILLVQSTNSLNEQSFYYSSGDGITTQEQSTQIFHQLKKSNLLDSQNQMTQLFDQNSELVLNILGMNDQIINNIKKTMLQSIWINQVIFKVQQSLFFKQDQSLIVTRSNSVNIIFSVGEGVGQFVIKDYPGAIISYSSKRDQLKFEGALTQINNILKEKILFFYNNNTLLQNTQITVTIQDNINFPLTFSEPINNCKYIVFKKQIKILQDNNLQSQILSKFIDSVVYIETSISITFQQNTFYVEDAQTINYKFQYKVNDQSDFQDIGHSFWLQSQSDKSLIMYGDTKYQQLRDTVVIKITASDGYTDISDEFTLKLTGIPFIYIFNTVVTIAGPLFASLGFFQYRYLLINRIFTKQYTYSDEIVFSDQLYEKKIPLLGITWKKSCQLVETLFEYKIEQKNQSKREKLNSKHIIYKISSDIKQNSEKLNKLESSLRNSFLEKKYLNQQDGSIKIRKIIKDIITYKDALFQKNKNLIIFEKQISSQLQQGSLLYEAVKSYCSYLFLQKDPKTNFAYQYIKKYLLSTGKTTKNDWYLQIVNFNHQKQDECTQSPFPDIRIKQLEMNEILRLLQIQSENRTFEGLKQLQTSQLTQVSTINFSLIENSIISEGQGLTFTKSKLFQYVQGESINLRSDQIVNIEGFKKAPRDLFYKLRQILGIQYVPYGVSENMKLPDWLQLKFEHGYIKLQGRPSTEEDDHTLIRIYNINGYIIKQFIINIVPYNSQTIINIPDENNLLSQSGRGNIFSKEDSLLASKQLAKNWQAVYSPALEIQSGRNLLQNIELTSKFKI